MDMGKLILIRHGQTEMNANRVYFGRLDPPLNEVGLNQVKKAREKFLDCMYDRIYSSPLKRARETAEICNHRSFEIEYVDDLMEIDFGIFEGLTYEEISRKYPDEIKKAEEEWQTYNYETGESLMDMQKRVINFLKSLDFSKTNVLVAHWGVINCILSHYMSGNLDTYWKFKVENGGIAVLEGDFDFCYLTKFI